MYLNVFLEGSRIIFCVFMSKRLRAADELSSSKRRRTETKVVAVRRPSVPRSIVVPGITRTGGEYARAMMARYGQETKYLDCTVDSASSGNVVPPTGLRVLWKNFAGTSSDITHVGQGASASQRIGNKIRPYQLRFKMRIAMTTISNMMLRIVLVEDKQCNGSYPGVGDVFALSGTLHGFDAFYNMNNVQRFRILKDKVFSPKNFLPPSDPAGIGYTVEYFFKMNAKLKPGTQMEYSGSSGAIAEVRSVNYYVFCFSNVAVTPTTLYPMVYGHSRLYFKE